MKHYNINYRKCCNYRCATDSSTRIVSQGLHVAKLSFNSFEFHNSKDNVYVECNATFCQKYYTTQACHTKRQIIDPVWIIIIDPVFIMKQAKTSNFISDAI